MKNDVPRSSLVMPNILPDYFDRQLCGGKGGGKKHLIGKGGNACIFEGPIQCTNGGSGTRGVSANFTRGTHEPHEKWDGSFAVKLQAVIGDVGEMGLDKVRNEIEISNRLYKEEKDRNYPKYTFFAGTEGYCHPSKNDLADMESHCTILTSNSSKKDETAGSGDVYNLYRNDEMPDSCFSKYPDYLEHQDDETYDCPKPIVLFTKFQKNAVPWGDFAWDELSDDDILAIWKHLMEGLKLMNYANVIHGDLHDENVILVKTDKWIPNIIDFGSASYIEEEHLFDYDSPAEDFWYLHKDLETGRIKPTYSGNYTRLLSELRQYINSKGRLHLTFEDLIKSIEELHTLKTAKTVK